VLWTSSTTEERVSLREDAPIPHIDLAELAEQAQTSSKNELVRLIEDHQERLVEELCGPRYSRGHPNRRGGTNTKSLVTCLGEIRFKAKKTIRLSDGKTATSILEVLDVKSRRYSRGVRIRLAEFASKMSYGDACTEFETATGVHVPKRTIHGFVGEIAPRLLEASRTATKAEVVIGDSHQGPGPGEQGDEQRTRPHLRRRAPAQPQGQRGVAQGRGRRPRLRR